jgi:hypothetical protein
MVVKLSCYGGGGGIEAFVNGGGKAWSFGVKFVIASHDQPMPS